MFSHIIPALKDHRLKPFCTQAEGNILMRGGSLLISSYGNVQMGVGISDCIGNTNKGEQRKGQYEAVCGLSTNATPEEARLALCKKEQDLFDEAKANKPMNNQAMKLKEGMAVSKQLTAINKEYNSQKDEISPQYTPTAIKELNRLVTIPLDDTCTLSGRFSLALKENKCWLPDIFGLIPSESLKSKVLSDCCIALTYNVRLQFYMTFGPDPQNRIAALIVCDYVLEDKLNQDMIVTAQASLEFTSDYILNFFEAYDGNMLIKVVKQYGNPSPSTPRWSANDN